jgi:hypothetical protein
MLRRKNDNGIDIAQRLLSTFKRRTAMRNFFLTLALIGFTIGCGNTTTTSGTTISTRTGETVTKKLSVTAAKEQTISRGSTDKVTVSVNRDNFNDPVVISFTGLPAGVEVVEKDMTIASSASSITLTLKASAEAALGEHNVTINAEAGNLPKNTQAFKLTIK